MYIFFFDESAKIPVKSYWRDFYLRGTRVCSYGIYFNILLMRILSDRLCKKKILSILSSDISTCEYNLNILFYELLFCYYVVNYELLLYMRRINNDESLEIIPLFARIHFFFSATYGAFNNNCAYIIGQKDCQHTYY